MKRIATLLLFLGTGLTAVAQCPTGNIVLVSQSDLAAFVAGNPGCSTIEGDLTIGDATTPPLSNIPSLQSLSGITAINGKLTIRGNTFLTSLNGLENLTKLGKLEISYNAVLSSIAALSNMSPLDTSIFDVTIRANDSLRTVNGLEGIKTAMAVTIHNSSSLKNLEGLSNLTYLSRDLSLFGNGLTSLHGLENLVRVGGLGITTNRSLVDLTGLANLTTIDGMAMFQDNDILANLRGLENLRSAGMIGFGMHNSLTSLEGLTNLSAVSSFILIDNPLLTSCAVKPVCETIGTPSGTLITQGNGGGCNSLVQIQEACAALPVRLVDFTAIAEGGAAHLAWTTAEEVNSDHFEIQTSTDAEKWITLGTLSSHGDSRQTHHYAFVHNNPPHSIHYYRLRMVDRDGTFTFSRIRSLTFNPAQVTLYPNPADDVVYLAGENLQHIERVTVTDSQGKIISEPHGDFRRGVSLKNIPAGLYFLNAYQATGMRVTFKVFKR
jgi:hypothetical protein